LEFYRALRSNGIERQELLREYERTWSQKSVNLCADAL
jgi:hypothetical protein